MNTIYAVVRMDKRLTRLGCNVYSKQTSNYEVMKAYREEIAAKHPSCAVVLVSRESAKIIKQKYYEYFKKTLDKSIQ